MNISGSVGSYESGAKNLANDVTTVQTLLTQVARKLGNPAFDPKGIDGKIGRIGSQSSTVAAITQFQTLKVGIRADQRIDANGRTWNTLVAQAGPVVPVAPLVPAPATGLITLTVQHGGLVPTKTTRSGNAAATYNGMYESTFTLSGGLTGTFQGSIFPDDMTVKGRVVDGTYPLHIGFHKGGGAAKQTAADLVVRTQGIRAGLLVNARNGVTVKSDNPGKTVSHGINVHNGFSGNRGSDGCLTLQPSDWSKFVQLFLTAFPNIADWHTIGNNTGKKIGDLVIKA
jgi:hypothetical protein